MTTRELTIGQQDPQVRNRQARQAGARLGHRPLRRLGRPRHGLPRREPARRHRLPAADGRLPGIHLRVGPHPRRLLQARRQAGGEGSADEPLHRPPDPAAVPGRLALRDADHRARAVGRSGERHRRPRDHRRLRGARALGDSVREDDRRRPHRPRRRPVHRQPDLPAAQGEQARPRRRRQQGRPGDGRSGREGSDRGAGRRGARDRARRNQADRRRRSTTSPKRPARRR